MGRVEFEAITDDDMWPLCPHCEEEIKVFKYYGQVSTAMTKVSRIFVCPHCNKVLGNGMFGI